MLYVSKGVEEMSSTIAELRVAGPGAVLTEGTLQTLPEAEIRIQYQATSQSAGIIVRGCDFDEFEAQIQSDPSIDNYERVAGFSDVHVYNITAHKEPTLISELLTEKGIQILEATSPSGSTMWRLRIRSPTREHLSEFITECRENRIALNLETLFTEASPPADASFRCPVMKHLTNGQYEALQGAYEMGYFDIPREVRLDELSQEFGISSQAMSERLRRGLSTLLKSHLYQK